MPAWIDEKGQQVWMCVCDCLNIRFLTTSQWNNHNRQSCGCLRVDVSRIRTTAMNKTRAGKPRSEKGKEASRIACKKMNDVRHLKARHIIDNIDSMKLTAVCRICGKVPIKIMKHRADESLRDQYLCWVGSLRVNDAYAGAKVRYVDHALSMYQNQKELCAICKEPMVRGAGLENDGMVLDHCHLTGFIRGFIHQRCNKGLGNFRDNPNFLRGAAEYLEKIKMEEECQTLD